MPSGLSSEQLTALARHGAANRIAELEAEIASIRRAFPDRSYNRRGRKPRRPRGAMTSAPKRRRRGMSAAARKAVSVRMKKYWADRRKTAGAKK